MWSTRRLAKSHRACALSEHRLWVDDERPAPEDWYWAKTSIDGIAFLELAAYSGWTVVEVSLDHDLGIDPDTEIEDNGFKVLDWIIENGAWPTVLTIHTANPPARERMLRAANATAPESVDIYIKTW